MCKMKTPDVKAPAPAPAPAEPAASVAQSEPSPQDTAQSLEDAKRKGRNSLRIPLSIGGAGGGSGLNIPVG